MTQALHTASSYYVHLYTNHTFRRKLFLFCVWFFVVQVAVYCTFLAMTVFEVVARKGVEQKNRSLASEISSLEEVYVKNSHEVGATLFARYGLSEVHTGTIYIYPNKASLVGMASVQQSIPNAQ